MSDAPSPYAGTVPVASFASSEGSVTLVEGQTFALSGRSGDMRADLPNGLFVLDTRVLSRWELHVNGHHLEPLLDDDIVYLGEIGMEEKVPLLQHATALVNPIRWPEPFGLVMIEALACGTPVLAFREGSAPELIDDGVTGALCDTVDELAGCIDRVHTLDRAACRRSAEERFSTERMVADHLDLYERYVGGARGADGHPG